MPQDHAGIIANQLALQAKTAGVSSKVILQATQGDYSALIDDMVTASATAKGRPFNLASAEYMRLSRPRLPR
jgi:hypothetical protein